VETTTSGSLFHWDPSNPSNLIVAGIIALIVAIADEIHQAYIPNRDASVIDVFLDIMGIILCMLIIKSMGCRSGFLRRKDLLNRTK
jgi:VanZ family protein